MESQFSLVEKLFDDLKPFQASIAIKWKKLLFTSSLTTNIRKKKATALKPLPSKVLESEESFREFFFLTMHLYKTMATLEDYLDLNRRYLGLTNCFVFDDDQVRLDIVPKQFFFNLKSATLLKSQSVAAQTAKNAIFLVWTDFLPCVG